MDKDPTLTDDSIPQNDDKSFSDYLAQHPQEAEAIGNSIVSDEKSDQRDAALINLAAAETAPNEYKGPFLMQFFDWLGLPWWTFFVVFPLIVATGIYFFTYRPYQIRTDCQNQQDPLISSLLQEQYPDQSSENTQLKGIVGYVKLNSDNQLQVHNAYKKCVEDKGLKYGYIDPRTGSRPDPY